MVDEPAAASSASWYPDPLGRHEHRYWDGSEWTEHVSDAGALTTDPLATTSAEPAAEVPPKSEPQHASPPVAARAALPLKAKSIGGTVIVDDTWVTIQRKGALAKATHGFTKGEKRIPIASITAVEFKKPGATNGYIRFTVPGVIERSRTKGVFDANDENAVMFTTFALAQFTTIRDHVETAIPHGAAPASPPTGTVTDVAGQLREFAKLRDEGILTTEEFEAQKAKLLARDS